MDHVEDHESLGTGRRLQRAETSLATLQTEVAGLKSDVGHVRTAISELHSAVNDLSRLLGSRNQTNWNVLFAAAAVLLSIVVYYNSLTMSPLLDRLAVHRQELSAINVRNLKRAKEIGRDEERLHELEEHQDKAIEMLIRRGMFSDQIPKLETLK